MLRRDFLALAPGSALAVAGRPRTGRQVPAAPAGDARFEAIADLVREKMRQYHVPVAGLGVSIDGRTTLRGFGVTSLDDPRPVSDGTIFTIASISKAVTATAIIRLVETGAVDLRAPIQRDVPDFRVQDDDTSRRVSLWHCLTHTPGWEGQLATEDRGAETLAHFASTIMPTLPQLAPAGSVWSYNNAGFGLSGRVIERVTGKSIHDALRDLVFAPPGLTRTATRLTDAMTYPMTLGHREREGRTEVIRPFQTTSSTTAGGVLTSIADNMAYARFHLGDGRTPAGARHVSRTLLELMQTPQLRKNATTDEMGVGWHARTVGGVMTLAHGGTLNGHCLLLQLVPARALAFCVFTNHLDGWRLVQDIEAAILKSYAGVGLEPGQPIGHRGVNEAMTFHSAPLLVQPQPDVYIGTYRRPPVGALGVKRDGDRLVVVFGTGQNGRRTHRVLRAGRSLWAFRPVRRDALRVHSRRGGRCPLDSGQRTDRAPGRLRVGGRYSPHVPTAETMSSAPAARRASRRTREGYLTHTPRAHVRPSCSSGSSPAGQCITFSSN